MGHPSAHVTELLASKYRNYHIRYTDGSKTADRSGFGVAEIDNNYYYRLPDQCSIFSAEAAAILLATTTPSPKPICVVSDSASVLTTLNSSTSRHPWIQAIQSSCSPETVFLWVPGHCGIRGNVEADLLAARGRSGRMFSRLTPGADVRTWCKAIIRLAWEHEWFRLRTLFIRKIKEETTRWTDTASRRDQQVLSRLRTGHTHVTHNMDNRGSFRKNCSTCNIIMTVEHLIINCPCYHDTRIRNAIPNSIKDALANDPINEATLLSFIKDAGLYKNI